MKEKRLSSLKSCLSLRGDAGWFPELDAVLKKREKERKTEWEGGHRGEGEGEKGEGEKERNFLKCRR